MIPGSRIEDKFDTKRFSTFGLRILKKELEAVDEVGSIEGISTNTNA